MPIITSLAALHIISANDIFVFNRTWDTDVSTFDLQTALVGEGWDGAKVVQANLVVNSGIVVSSNTTAQAAITIPALPTGSVVNILNNGFIIGMGGRGGSSAQGTTTGEAGGDAITTNAICRITNNGTIGGGGGGGGARLYLANYGGGGGRSGRTNSLGGTANGGNGAAGTFTAAGTGASGGSTGGGAGGNWGTAGATAYGSAGINSAGGAGGRAVVGNANVTWLTTGTVMGALV